MSQERLYLKKQLITFFKKLGYVGGVIPLNEASRKRLKWFVETCILMEANTKDEMNVIFGKLSVSLSFDVCYLYI